jgi:AraC-like DNA-binding protein
MLNFPFFARTGNIAGFLIVPFLYLYTRNTFYPGIRWRKSDWLFIIPALFYVIDLMPFFLANGEYKTAIMRANLDDPARQLRVAEGWFPVKGIHYTILYVWNILMLALQFRLIYRNRQMARSSDSNMNRSLFWFIVTFTALHIPLVVPGIFGLLLKSQWYSLGYLSFILSAHLITVALYILFSPKVLYGFYPQTAPVGQAPAEDGMVTGKPRDVEVQPRNVISAPDLQILINKIETYMSGSRPYLNKQYNIHTLSVEVGIPVYQLSPIINQYYQSNFNTWVNTYRVNHFIELWKNQEKDVLTLEAIAEESGFNNRSTFISAFKKITGSTPGNYLKQLPKSI